MAKQGRSFHWLSVGISLMAVFFMGVSCANSAPLSLDGAAPGSTMDIAIYGDTLAPTWSEGWSWDSTLNLANPNPVHSGTAAIAVTHTAGWAGLSLRTSSPLATADLSALAFWIYGNGAPLGVYVQTTDNGEAGTLYEFAPAAGEWSEITIPLSALGSPAQITRVTWQNRTPNVQPVYYVDDIRLIGAQPPAPGAAITLNVDAMASRKPISPYIYGMNEYGTDDDPATLLSELRLPVRRWGGNATSRYNWQNDNFNHASDWYFNNNKQSNAIDLPADSAVNRFITTNRNAGIDSFVVLPLIGYIANDNPMACGFSVAKYGPQKETAANDGRPDCGNGIRPDGTLITGNDPLDTSIAVNAAFVANWVSALVTRFGGAANDGVRFYNYDNEPDLWFQTHRDVQPVGYTYDKIRDLTYDYGAAIKSADPAAQLLGPAVHGWSYYWHSPYDGQREDWATPDDRNAHGGTEFVAWYLQQMATYEADNNIRILDYLDLHYYPQASGVALGEAGNEATQALRLRSTRSLWDPTYIDESWIAAAGPDGGIVRLLPRMRAWVDANYPGTKLAIGEYNWGGLEQINGALAQADVLGIFGREQVDLATLWQPPRLNQPGAFAFRIYRNYDGAGAHFGDTSVAATSSNQELLSIYAGQRSSDSALTVIIINKSGINQNAALTLENFGAAASAQLYRYSPANLNAIVRGDDIAIAASAAGSAGTDHNQAVTNVTLTYPANSMTLLVIPFQAPPQNPPPEGPPQEPPQDPPPQTFDTYLRLPLTMR